MTARQLQEALTDYLKQHPDAADVDVQLTIYRSSRARYYLRGTVSGTGWSSGGRWSGQDYSEHITMSVREKDLQRV